ncbi:hypothetical protein [Rhodoplanes azumiensis]|uniref:4Fe-4S Wbl-type domain-containing protein n=1 Tax=Rhodoplanes azumiensis TaxID=1897628 RepID=A0ABW5AF10_9BRAD
MMGRDSCQEGRMPRPQRSWVDLAAILRMRRDRPPRVMQFREAPPAGPAAAEAMGGDAGLSVRDDRARDDRPRDDIALDFDTDNFDTDYFDTDDADDGADAGFRTAGSVVIDDLLLCRRMRALRLDPDELYCSEPRAFGMLHRLCATCPVPGRCARDLADEFADPAWQDWRNYCPNATTLSILSALRGCGLDDAEAPADR